MASSQVEFGDTVVGPLAKKQKSVGFQTFNLRSASSMASPQLECGDTFAGLPAKKQKSVGFRTRELRSVSSMARPQEECVDTFVGPPVKKQPSRPEKKKKQQWRGHSSICPPEDNQKWGGDGSDYDEEEHRKYVQQVNDSGGFDIETDYGHNITSGVVKLDLSKNEDITRCAQFAVNQHNMKKDESLELVRVVKANIEMVAGFIFYVTLEAKNRDGEIKTYQVKVSQDIEEVYGLEQFKLASPKPLVTN